MIQVRALKNRDRLIKSMGTTIRVKEEPMVDIAEQTYNSTPGATSSY